MSDEPERVFSGARRTINWSRMQLGIEKIEKTQCLKSWLKADIISKLTQDASDDDDVDDEGDDEFEAVDGVEGAQG